MVACDGVYAFYLKVVDAILVGVLVAVTVNNQQKLIPLGQCNGGQRNLCVGSLVGFLPAGGAICGGKAGIAGPDTGDGAVLRLLCHLDQMTVLISRKRGTAHRTVKQIQSCSGGFEYSGRRVVFGSDKACGKTGGSMGFGHAHGAVVGNC